MTSQTNPAIRMLINLDITGSMAGEMEGVKQTVSQLITFLQDVDVPLSIAIVTFTENAKGCYVSLAEFTELIEARGYVQDLKLCVPPDFPKISASGDDGDENQKAALHRLLDLEPMPTIGFLITDASPHLGVRANNHLATIGQELRWLEGRGVPSDVARDFFQVFALVHNHFDGALVLNCVVYGSMQLDEIGVYANVAQMTGGMLMRPLSRTPDVLAKGMMDVVKTVLCQLSGQGADGQVQVTELEGFELFDITELPYRQTEQDPSGTLLVGDNATIFAISMERTLAVCGSKWTKRAVGMSAPAEQLQFVWRTARYLVQHSTAPAFSLDAELAALMALRESIVSKLPDEMRGHFSISASDVERLAQVAAAATTAAATEAPAVSVVSLETVGEALAEDADWEDWLATVMRLLVGYPMTVQLPKDKMGKPDFADAWSAVTTAIGCDHLSSADFMRLLGDSPTALGPTDRLEHNAFLLLADPADSLGSLVFRVASGTQVLNYVTGILMGARGFLPNLHTGCAAAALMRLVYDGVGPMPEFQQKQAQQIVHTLRSLHTAPARKLKDRLLNDGVANPSDPISKLLAVAVRGVGANTSQLPSALRLVLEEWVFAAVQRHYGKRSPESDLAYLTSLLQYLPMELLVPGSQHPIDPTQQLHALEGEQAKLMEQLGAGWEEACVERLLHGVPEQGLPPHTAVMRFEAGALRLLNLLMPGPELESMGVAACWPDWRSGVLQAVLQRQRGNRYTCLGPVEEGSTELVWERVAAEGADGGTGASCASTLAVSRMREACCDMLKRFKAARVAHAEDALLAATTAALMSARSEQAATEALQGLYVQVPSSVAPLDLGRPLDQPRGPMARLLNIDVRFERSSVPRIIQRMGTAPLIPLILRSLVQGDWTSMPPQALRNSQLVVGLCLEEPDLTALLRSATRCTRSSGYNRHGHSETLQYPGPCGWTTSYANERLAQRPGSKAYVKRMEQFTAMAEWARATGSGGGQLMQVEAVLVPIEDANELPAVQAKLEGLLGVAMPSL